MSAAEAADDLAPPRRVEPRRARKRGLRVFRPPTQPSIALMDLDRARAAQPAAQLIARRAGWRDSGRASLMLGALGFYVIEAHDAEADELMRADHLQSHRPRWRPKTHAS